MIHSEPAPVWSLDSNPIPAFNVTKRGSRRYAPAMRRYAPLFTLTPAGHGNSTPISLFSS